MTDSPIKSVGLSLEARGFKFVRRRSDNWLEYSGSIVAESESHRIHIAVHPKGLELPAITLEEIPDRLRPIAPHIGSNGAICYAAKGSIALDVFDIPGQTLSCVDRAAEVLGSILRGEMVPDLEEEFFAYWRGNICLLDLARTGKNPECIFIEGGRNNNVSIVTNDRSGADAKVRALGGKVTQGEVLVRRVRTTVPPRPLIDRWPVRTVSEFLHWQGILDPPCRKKLDAHIADAFKCGAPAALCIIESPRMSYGALIGFKRAQRRGRGASGLKFRELLYPLELTPMQFVRIDDEYIASRNSPEVQHLAGRRIALIGCGTIGGFLAELLIKAGAGTQGGKLTLVDHDILLPQNVGRHRLGFNFILQNKAEALAEELRRLAPTAVVQALPVDVMEANLSRKDLLINATGEEWLGHLLSERFKGSNFIPMLSVWIEGPGTAVRALLRDKPKAACTRCLTSSSRDPIYPVVSGVVPSRLVGHGCESLYVPFPASVSVQAACVAMEMISAWRTDTPVNRLQTLVVDKTLSKGAHDQNPPQRDDCPACRS